MDLLSHLNLKEGIRVVQFGFDGSDVPLRVLSSIRGNGRLLILLNSERKADEARRALTGWENVNVVYSPVIEPSSFDAALVLNALGEVLGKRELLNEVYRLLRPGGRCVVYQKLSPFAIGFRRRIRRALTERMPFRVLELRIGLLEVFASLEKA
jgi:ubiquinone/menaquinone biosynthesis C-methylase UbiE